MRWVAAAIVVWFLAGDGVELAHGQPPGPVQARRESEGLRVPPPIPPHAVHPVPAEHPGIRLSKWEHLMQAAQHLEAAGMNEDAARIRKAAETERPAAPRQILVEVKMYDVNVTKLRKQGFDWPGALSPVSIRETPKQAGGQPVPAPTGPGHVSVQANDDGRLSEMLDSLCRDNLARVLSKPTLVTTNGTAAHVRVGSPQPAKAKQETPPDDANTWCGTDLQVLPEILPDGRIRCQLRYSFSEPGPNPQQSAKLPRVQTVATSNSVTLAPKETFATGGLVHGRTVTSKSADQGSTEGKPREETELWEYVLLIRAYTIEPMTIGAAR